MQEIQELKELPEDYEIVGKRECYFCKQKKIIKIDVLYDWVRPMCATCYEKWSKDIRVCICCKLNFKSKNNYRICPKCCKKAKSLF